MNSIESKRNATNDQPHHVFYDDRCSLCTAEINHYQKLETCHPLEWVGIHQDQDIVKRYGFTQKQLLERLHVIRGSGETDIGAYAFVTIWLSIKRYKVIGLLVQKLRFTRVLNIFYEYFAKRRYQKRICKI